MTYKIRIETQMRAGTHYLASSLAIAYCARVAQIEGAKFVFQSPEKLNEGLPGKLIFPKQFDDNIIYQNHYYHDISNVNYDKESKVIFLIGFPFDSFFSDGLVFSSEKYSVKPSIKNERFNAYKLKFGSPEWNFLVPYMIKNAQWLENLASSKNRLIIRYEDFFIDFNSVIEKIENYCGKFINPFPIPLKNSERIYWANDYLSKIDQEAFQFIQNLFSKGLQYFYPEKYKKV